MRAVIIAGGTITDYGVIKTHIRHGDTIICADSGYDHAVSMGIEPHLVVGDFDSVSAPIPPHIPTAVYPAGKDMTDTELAIEHARQMGFSHFILLAAAGTRIDHSLTNIMLLTDCHRRNETAVIATETETVQLVHQSLTLDRKKGTLVSLIPLSNCSGVSTSGLEYPLSGAAMKLGSSLGVSNVMSAEAAVVSVKDGLLLVVVSVP
jgi:thiamine pyrophosphokinase